MKSFKIAVIGLGNVGQAFITHCQTFSTRLRDEYDTRLMLVGAADTSGVAISPYGLRPAEILEAKQSGKRLSELEDGFACASDSFVWRFKSAGANLIVETLPSKLDDGQPALEMLEHAIAERMHVITANKGAMVYGLHRLERAAREEGVGLRYSAAAGSGLPTIGFGLRDLAGARIEEISGILNGTSNYILTALETGKSYAEALSEAQAAGMAEPDPTQDVEGFDTAAKLVIIANKLMGSEVTLADVNRRGITEVVPRPGTAIRLIGRATRQDDGVRLTVAPEEIPPGHSFINVRGAAKGVIIKTDTLGEFTIIEDHSSRATTAAAIFKDLIHLAQEFG